MSTNLRQCIVLWLLAAVCLLLFPACLASGSVDIPLTDVWGALTGGDVSRQAWTAIVLDSRLPSACTALLAGAALAVAGLLMQTTFDNPLAGPSILGISTGASLGVALVMLSMGSAIGLWGRAAVLGGAFGGALAIMLVLLSFSSLVRSATMLLIVGILIGYVSSSAISLLNFFATQEGVHSFVIWGLGNFSGVDRSALPLFAALVILGVGAAMLYIKTLNALLLGARYARSVGVNLRATRNGLLVIAGALTAVVTAWCGPIGFIGLIVPHVARLALRSSNHRFLLPATALAGGATGLLCLWLSVLPRQWGVLPVNAITPVIGVPVMLYVIVNRRKIYYFN